MKVHGLIAALASMLAACGDGAPAVDGTNEALRWSGGDSIRIARSALGEEFLMQVSLVEQDQANFSYGLESKIVRFEINEDRVLMIEAGDGQTIAAKYESALARFPILAENNRSVTIDFDEGMRNAFAFSADWHASDDFFSFDQEPHELKESYIVDAGNEAPFFVVEQAAQVDYPSWLGGSYRVPHVFKYYFRRYQANENYTPYESPGHDFVSFFEAAPRYQDDLDVKYHATRFDQGQPIVFYVSDAVPAEFREAVRDGVLYWNAVMGRSLVEVHDAPEGVHAPDLRHNVIEWIDWEDAGFAYADAQVDPRTGETLHAQVFMTSSWAIYAREQLFQLALKVTNPPAPAIEHEEHAVKAPTAALAADARAAKTLPRGKALLGLRGFHLARREANSDGRAFAHYVRGLQRLTAAGASEAVLLEASKDVIRGVVAHEIGHTLGLRHNFAGSASTNYGTADEEEIIEHYLSMNGQAPPDIVPSTTVMDYHSTLDDFIVGDLVQRRVALAYDVAAMAVLYDGASIDRDVIPPLGNDTIFYSLGYGLNYFDANLWDRGASMVEAALAERNDFLQMAATDVIARAVAYETDPDRPRPAETVTFDPQFYAVFAVIGGFTSHLGLWEVLSMMYDENAIVWGPALSVPLKDAYAVPSYPNIGELERDDLIASRELGLMSELDRFGGLAEVMAPLDQLWIDEQHARLEALLDNPTLTSGISARGTPYALTPAQVDGLRAKGQELISAIPKHYFAELVIAMTNFYGPLSGLNQEAIAEARTRLARNGVFLAGTEVLTATVTLTSSTTEITRTVTVLQPLFEQADRIAAAQLMGGEAPESDWLDEERDALIADIELEISNVFGVTLEELRAQKTSVPHPLRRWAEDLIAIYDELALLLPL